MNWCEGGPYSVADSNVNFYNRQTYFAMTVSFVSKRLMTLKPGAKLCLESRERERERERRGMTNIRKGGETERYWREGE